MKVSRKGIVWLSVIVLVVCLVSGAAVAGVKSRGAAPYRLAYFTPIVPNDYSLSYWHGIQAAAKQYGAKAVAQFDSKLDVQKQIAQVQDVITTNQADGLILIPDSGPPLVPILRTAVKKGHLVGIVSSSLGTNYRSIAPPVKGLVTASAFVPVALVAKEGADILGKSCAKINPCKVFLLQGIRGYSFDVGFAQGFFPELKKFPNVKIVATAFGNYDVTASLKATQDVLQAHPDINAIVTDGDQMGHGADLALKGTSLDGKLILLGSGGGGSTYGVAAVKAGRWVADNITANYSAGYFVAKSLILAHQGKRVKNPYRTDPQLIPGYANTFFLTKKNVGKFKAQWKS